MIRFNAHGVQLLCFIPDSFRPGRRSLQPLLPPVLQGKKTVQEGKGEPENRFPGRLARSGQTGRDQGQTGPPPHGKRSLPQLVANFPPLQPGQPVLVAESGQDERQPKDPETVKKNRCPGDHVAGL